MFFKFLPKDTNFFDLFDKQVDCTLEAAKIFKNAVNKSIVDEEDIKKIQNIEHDGDKTSYNIISQLNDTFITPFDRGDIHSLTKELDDIIDMIYTIMNRMNIYKIKGANKNLVDFSLVIEESVIAVASAVKALRDIKNPKSILDSCLEINRLENVADKMRNSVLQELFENEKDPIEIIKLKEIYEDAEDVLDVCEEVAHIIESIIVKQA
jgi:hypothetical protein